MQGIVACDVCGWTGHSRELNWRIRPEPRCPVCLNEDVEYLREDPDED